MEKLLKKIPIWATWTTRALFTIASLYFIYYIIRGVGWSRITGSIEQIGLRGILFLFAIGALNFFVLGCRLKDISRPYLSIEGSLTKEAISIWTMNYWFGISRMEAGRKTGRRLIRKNFRAEANDSTSITAIDQGVNTFCYTILAILGFGYTLKYALLPDWQLYIVATMTILWIGSCLIDITCNYTWVGSHLIGVAYGYTKTDFLTLISALRGHYKPLIWGILSALLFASEIYFLTRFAGHPLSIMQSIAVLIVSTMLFWIPSFGAIGIYEICLVLICVAFGINGEVGFAIALLQRIRDIIFSTYGFYYAHQSIRSKP